MADVFRIVVGAQMAASAAQLRRDLQQILTYDIGPQSRQIVLDLNRSSTQIAMSSSIRQVIKGITPADRTIRILANVDSVKAAVQKALADVGATGGTSSSSADDTGAQEVKKTHNKQAEANKRTAIDQTETIKEQANDQSSVAAHAGAEKQKTATEALETQKRIAGAQTEATAEVAVEQNATTLRMTLIRQLSAIANAEAVNRTRVTKASQNEINRLMLRSDKLLAKLDSRSGSNPRAVELANQVRTAQAAFKSSKTSAKDFASTLDSVEGTMVRTGINAQTLGEKFEKFFGYRLSYVAFQLAYQALSRVISSLYNNVKELDTAMTELKKVTDETDATYEKFLDNAATRAKKLGAALSDVVTATADAARLGLSLNEAEALADASVVYKNVGDGIEDINDASESIISTMQAFGIEATDSMQIVDRFNEVGNNFAISSKGVGDALLNSASALQAANNSIDQSIALVTAANEVIQDPQKVGTAMKTISMYLRAAKTEAEEAGESTDGMANSVSELRQEILSLTGNRVDIMIDDKTFKSTYDIMKELSIVWDDLSDITQANILELIGGKRNSNVVTALLGNFEKAEEVVEKAGNSAGSALRENEKYLDSIEGKLSKFTATWEEASSNILDSGLVKGFITVFTWLIDLINKIDTVLGGFGAELLIVGSVFAVVNAIVKKFAKDTVLSTGIAKAAFASLKTKALDLGAAFQLLKTQGFTFANIVDVFNLNPWVVGITAAAVAVFAAVKAFKKLNPTLEETREKFDNLKSESDDLKDQLEENNKRIIELLDLRNQGTLNIVEEDELEALQRENELLEAQIALKEAQLDVDKQILAQKARDTAEAFLFTDEVTGYAASGGAGEIEDILANIDQLQEEKRVALDVDYGDYGDVAGPYLAEFIDNQVKDIDEKILAETDKLFQYVDEIESIMDNLDLSNEEDYETYLELQKYLDKISIAAGAASGNLTQFKNICARPEFATAATKLQEMADKGQLTANSLRELYLTADDNDPIKTFIDYLIEIFGLDPLEFPKLADYFNDIATAADNANNSLNAVAPQTVAQHLEQTKPAFDALTAAMDDMNEQGQISADTYQDIAENHEDLLPYLTETANGFAIQKDALEDYLSAQAISIASAAGVANAQALQKNSYKETSAAIVEQIKLKRAEALADAQAVKAQYTKDGVISESLRGNADYIAAGQKVAAYDKALKEIANQGTAFDMLLTDYTYSSSKSSSSSSKDKDYDEIYKELVTLYDNYERASNRMDKMSEDMSADQLDMWTKLRNKIIAEMDKITDHSSDAYKYLEDMLIDVNGHMEEIYETQTSAIDSIIDMTKEMIKEEYEDQIDSIEKQTDAYNDLIDAKKKAFETAKDEADYEDQIAEKVKEIAKLQSNINKLGLDDSREAAAKRAELEEELAAANKELAEMQREHSLEITEEALDESAEQYEKAQDKKTEALEDAMDDEMLIYEQAIDRIGQMEEDFYDQLKQWAQAHGEDILEFADNWEVAKNALKGYTDLAAAKEGIQNAGQALQSGSHLGDYQPTGSGAGSSGGGPSGSTGVSALPEASGQITAGNPYKKVPTGSPLLQKGSKGEEVAWLQHQLIKLGLLKTEDGNPTWDFWTATEDAVRKFQELAKIGVDGKVGPQTIAALKRYHTGGVVGDQGSLKDYEMLAVLKKNELILDDGRKANLSKILDELKSTISTMTANNLFGNMKAMGGLTPAVVGGDTYAPVVHVNINHNGTMTDADADRYAKKIGQTALDTLYNAMRTRGIK